jgi:hypothetical protein
MEAFPELWAYIPSGLEEAPIPQILITSDLTAQVLSTTFQLENPFAQ